MNAYALFFLAAYVSVMIFGYWLEHINIAWLHRQGETVPPEFEGKLDQSTLNRTRAYTVENTRFGVVASVFNSAVFLVFLFGGPLKMYDGWVRSFGLPFVLTGLLFFLPLMIAGKLLGVPFSLYHAFRLESKYGFNTLTPRLWAVDFVKSLALSTVLVSIMISGGLWIVLVSPERWWLLLWVFFFAFSLFVMYIAPYVIDPLFNTFTPLEDEELAGEIGSLMDKAGIKIRRVFTMDASKRSKHSNAYFSGIGKVKRIVLFDTLVELMGADEILAVLAHEAGHWKKRHIMKSIALTELIAFGALYLSFQLTRTNLLADIFRIGEGTFFAKLVILGFLGSIALFPLTPLLLYLSRRNEREADDYSVALTGDADGMSSSLVKLAKDNLSNLTPHPLYVAFHYSHPPLLERIRRLRRVNFP